MTAEIQRPDQNIFARNLSISLAVLPTSVAFFTFQMWKKATPEGVVNLMTRIDPTLAPEIAKGFNIVGTLGEIGASFLAITLLNSVIDNLSPNNPLKVAKTAIEKPLKNEIRRRKSTRDWENYVNCEFHGIDPRQI